MKRKEVRKLVGHFLKLHSTMAGSGKQLTALQAKLHYLDIVAQLPSYGAKCFSAGPRADAMERVILVSPKFGISQITGTRNSVVFFQVFQVNKKVIWFFFSLSQLQILMICVRLKYVAMMK